MGRVKIKFPAENPIAKVTIPVRISDINYGGHVGNDSILSIIHESRVQWLAQNGYTELNIDGVGLIMADVMIAYKGEAFYGDVLSINVFAEEITEYTFDLLYHISAQRNDGSSKDIAHAKTAMVCFDYNMRQKTNMPDALKKQLQGLANL